jgi:hypothetical protein
MRRESLLDCTEADFGRINFNQEQRKLRSDTRVVSTGHSDHDSFRAKVFVLLFALALSCVSIYWISCSLLRGCTRLLSLPIPGPVELHICGSPSDLVLHERSISDRENEIHRALQCTALGDIHWPGTNIKELPSHFRSGEETVREVINSITSSTPHYR